jgi:hypothetical protein
MAVSDGDILNQAREIVRVAVKRRAAECGWPDRGLPSEYRELPSTAWGGRGNDADYQRLETSLSWIVDAFRNAIPPDPAGFDNLIQCMNSAVTALRGGTELRIEKVAADYGGKLAIEQSSKEKFFDKGTDEAKSSLSDALSDWAGDAAEQFKSNFVNKIPGVIANQTAVALSLQSAAEGSKLVYETAREKLQEIATATLNVLLYKDDTVSPDLSIPLSLTAGGLAVGSAIPGIGTAGVLVLTTLSAGAGVGKDLYDDARDQAEDRKKTSDSKKTPVEREVEGFHIGGVKVEAILDRAYEAVRKVTSQVVEAEDTIIRVLETNIEAMRDEPKAFRSPRPHFIDYTTSPAGLRELRSAYFVAQTDGYKK